MEFFKEKNPNICNTCGVQFTPSAYSKSLLNWHREHVGYIPALANIPVGALCDVCLLRALSKVVRKFTETLSIESAQNKNYTIGRWDKKNALEQIDYYIENNFYVFTKWHHLKRGYCCKSNCRHCAYGFRK